MGNTTNNIKGDDVEMNKGLKLITIINNENEKIHIDEKILEMAINNGITIDEIFKINKMASKEILKSLEKTNKEMKQSLKDIEEKDDTLRNSRETLIAEATERIDKLKATERIDKPTKIKKSDNVLLVVAAFLLGSLSTSILYGIINLLF